MKILNLIIKSIWEKESMNLQKIKKNLLKFLPIIICVVFFLAYSTLAIVKHNHFLSGYDLAVNDQGIWKYSQFKDPVTTVPSYPAARLSLDPSEPVLLLVSPSSLL